MGDMKDKVKDFMKKVNNPFSSSGKFKGQARTLGSSSSGSTDRILPRLSNPNNSKVISNPPSISSYNSNSSPQETTQKERPKSILLDEKEISSNPNDPPPNGFDPFDPLITSGRRNKNGYSLNVFECPVCKRAFGSAEEVSVHVESCLDNSRGNDVGRGDGVVSLGSEVRGVDWNEKTGNELEVCVGAYVSGRPSQASVDVVLRLLRNIVKEPGNAKFRKIRMNNPKIREAVTEVAGCIELLELLGFVLKEEEGETWSVMDTPSDENICMLKKAISLLEPNKMSDSSPSAKVDEHVALKAVNHGSSSETKVADRQVRVFFSVPESVASKIDLPESFYKLSVEELRRESEQRKKKIAESQLLIPKSYKEKQSKAARSRYTKTIIRVQFPDGVVLQGVFSPCELTSILYEFVNSSLKQPGLEFELLHPVPVKRRVIPCSAATGEKVPTLDKEDLVPAALVKFRPVETDSVVFTGLRDDLLEISEPLSNSSSTAR